MELNPELLLQEARENVEAAQSYRQELGQRLLGLREAQRQVGQPRPEGCCGPRGACPAGGRGPGGLGGVVVSENCEGRREEALNAQGDQAGSGNSAGGAGGGSKEEEAIGGDPGRV